MRPLVSLGLALVLTIAIAQAQSLSLPNLNFETELEHWQTRTKTRGVYRVYTRPGDNSKYFQFDVLATSPQRDRAGVYIIRRDLPAQEGYYRLRYRAKSMLTAGRMGARINVFGADDALLVRYAPGLEGNPLIIGQGEWTAYQYVFSIPANAKTVALQFEMNSAIGKVVLDRIALEKLDAAQGKQLVEQQQKIAAGKAAQKKVVVIPTFQEKPARAPQYPLKSRRMLFTDADIETARQNIAQYAEGKVVLEDILAIANPWLEWKDEELRDLIPSAQVPRDFDVNPRGCPVHGEEIFAKNGTYPWILDPHLPFKVKCPVGGEVYPSNDYQAYYKSGFKEKKAWDTVHVDDGWGWVAPDGERYLFVAYANHWILRNHVLPAMLNLSRAYLLTGDKRYAHKAAVLLHRLAEIYPGTNYEKQSYFALRRKAAGKTYTGKLFSHIWETRTAQDFAEAYDAIWETIDGDQDLQQMLGKDGQGIRSFIEANLLEEAMDAYEQNKISGNYGTHQNALLQVLLSREKVDVEKYFHLLVDEPGQDRPHSGLRYTLYNQIWRDGNPLESPGYNWGGFTVNYAELSELLQRGGYDLYQDPKIKLLFDWPLNILAIGRFTPDIGDGGSTLGGIRGNTGPNALTVYAPAYQRYKELRYLRWLSSSNLLGSGGMTRFDSLFKPLLPVVDAPKDGRALPPQPSRLFAGYGLGMLNNRQDTAGLSLTYGFKVSHYHWDFLNFELFANGQKMMPDFGYPDAMNGFVKEVYTWSKNTVAHNTVIIDERRQDSNSIGVLHHCSDSDFARSIDASSGAYPQATQYRRNMIMVDAGENQSYVVDVFRVKGGRQHDYLLHGPPGEAKTLGGQWSQPAKGTLAGENVEWGQIYDDKTMDAANYQGEYSTYAGSGYQYLSKVQRLQSGSATLQYQHVSDPKAQLRIHLPANQPQEVMIADAYDLPRKKSHVVKYVIARRKAEGAAPLESVFTSVLETYAGVPFIKSNKHLPLQAGDGVAIQVEREGEYDIVLSSPDNEMKRLAQDGIQTDANSAALTFSASHTLKRVYFSGGSYLQVGDRKFTAPVVKGKVSAVAPDKQTVTVELEQAPSLPAAEIARRIAYFGIHAHPLASASLQQNRLTLKTQDALLVGRLRVSSVGKDVVATETALPFSPTYNGTTLLNAKFERVGGVKSVRNGSVQLDGPLATPLAAKDDAWLSNVGVGDQFTLTPVFSQVFK